MWPIIGPICGEGGHGSYYSAKLKATDNYILQSKLYIYYGYSLSTPVLVRSTGTMRQLFFKRLKREPFGELYRQLTSSHRFPKAAIEIGYVGYLKYRTSNN